MDLPGRSTTNPLVSVIVPARNEEALLGRCLESLAAQTEVDFEIIVVDDGSTDRTREIAQSFPGVRVIDAGRYREIGPGKIMPCSGRDSSSRPLVIIYRRRYSSHRRLAGTSNCRGQLTAHLFLSYSPKQEVHGFWEKAFMPVIFAELASTYRPSVVSDPASPVAAANGQYILFRARPMTRWGARHSCN